MRSSLLQSTNLLKLSCGWGSKAARGVQRLVENTSPCPRGKAPEACVTARANFTTQATTVSKEEKRDFMTVFPDIVRDLSVSKLGSSSELSKVEKWLNKASFLVAEDYMNKRETRKDKPSWYSHADVGASVFNDAMLLHSCSLELLRLHCQDKDYYDDSLAMFLKVSRYHSIGQCLAQNFRKESSLPISERFSLDAYNTMVKYKKSYYSFVLPVVQAMLMTGMAKDHEAYRQSKTILVEMGRFFQVQDDYVDCYGIGADPIVGNDIACGKCNWLIVVALQRCNAKQRAVLEDSYGSLKVEDVQKVMEIYDELKIKQIYSRYEHDLYEEIKADIQKLTRGVPHKLFHTFLKKVDDKFLD